MTMTAAGSVHELNTLDLAGYGNPAPLDDVLTVSGNILTLLVASQHPVTGDVEFLTSVRKPDQMYPWAISLPTGRIAVSEMVETLERKSWFEAGRDEPILIPQVQPGYEGELSRRRQIARWYSPNAEVLAAAGSAEEPAIARVTRELLSRKFDIAPGASDRSLGAVSLHDVTVGLVGGDDLGVVEYNTSSLVVVSLDDRRLIPATSTGYESNSWVGPEQFMEGYATRQPELMHPGIDGASLAFVCTNGQCLRGGEAAISDLEELMSHTDFQS